MALRYFPYHRLLPLFAFAALAALAILLVIFRAHYTADVLTAIYVTWGGWLLMQPYETRDLTKYGIRANVLIRPNYQSMGTDPWRARQAIGPSGEAEAAEEAAAEARGSGGGGGGGGALTRAMEEGKVAGVTEAAREGKEKEEAEGGVGACRRCCLQVGSREGDGGRRSKQQQTTTYLPPLPPSCPPLVEYADMTESARAFERLP